MESCSLLCSGRGFGMMFRQYGIVLSMNEAASSFNLTSLASMDSGIAAVCICALVVGLE